MSSKTAAWLSVAIVVSSYAGLVTAEEKENSASPQEIFNQRIMPIFKSEKPSSCVQCHLSSVDLKNYISASPEETFASLRDNGLIDIKSPKESKILSLIAMGDKDLDVGAKLIHEKMRKLEHDAFSSWIEACCNDSNMLSLPVLAELQRVGPSKPDAVIRHTRKSRVVDSFVRNVWSQRMRCFPCHTPNEIDSDNPKHAAALKTRATMKKQYPDLFPDRMDLFLDTPEATLQSLISKSKSTPKNELPLLNLRTPQESLLVLKPLSKLPKKLESGEFGPVSYAEPVSHGGGLKMHPNDQSYKSFVAWIKDYSNVVGGHYASVGDLPADNWYASKLVLRMTDAPKDWAVGSPIQMFIHEWNESKSTWSLEPSAFTQGTVTPRGIVNGSLFVFRPNDPDLANRLDPEAAQLTQRKLMVKVYVDSEGKLAKDATAMLNAEDFQGKVELPANRWRETFRSAKVFSASKLSK